VRPLGERNHHRRPQAAHVHGNWALKFPACADGGPESGFLVKVAPKSAKARSKVAGRWNPALCDASYRGLYALKLEEKKVVWRRSTRLQRRRCPWWAPRTVA